MSTSFRYKFNPKHISKLLAKKLPEDIEETIANFLNEHESFAIKLMKDKFKDSLGKSLDQNYNNFFNIDFRVLYFKFGLNKYKSLETKKEQEKLKEEFIKEFIKIEKIEETLIKETLIKVDLLDYDVTTDSFSYFIRSGNFQYLKSRNTRIDKLNENMTSLKKEYNITVKKNIIDKINSAIEKYNSKIKKYKLKDTKLKFIKLNKLLKLYPKQRYLSSTRSRTRSSNTRTRRTISRRTKSI